MEQYYSKKWFNIFVIFGVILVIFIVYIYKILSSNLILDQHNEIIAFNKNASARKLVNDLYNKKLIEHPLPVLIYIKIFGLEKQLKAGIYMINPHESCVQLLKRIIKADVLKLNFKIIAGTTNAQIINTLNTSSYLNNKNLDWHTLQVAYTTLKIPQDISNFDGLFLADTYQYNADSDTKNLLNQAHKQLEKTLLTAWENRQNNLPYKSPYELLTAASIIEKESANFADRYKISSVIVNRLKNNMPLQMDPTVIYGLGSKYCGKLTHKDLQQQSPYNTYQNRGLPPTPIANVASDAILAASQPGETHYLYFVAKGDGTHEFSENYNAQKQAIKQYLGNKKYGH